MGFTLNCLFCHSFEACINLSLDQFMTNHNSSILLLVLKKINQSGDLPNKANGQATGECCQHSIPTERLIPLSQCRPCCHENSWLYDG